jgi:hypothetical protein
MTGWGWPTRAGRPARRVVDCSAGGLAVGLAGELVQLVFALLPDHGGATGTVGGRLGGGWFGSWVVAAGWPDLDGTSGTVGGPGRGWRSCPRVCAAAGPGRGDRTVGGRLGGGRFGSWVVSDDWLDHGWPDQGGATCAAGGWGLGWRSGGWPGGGVRSGKRSASSCLRCCRTEGVRPARRAAGGRAVGGLVVGWWLAGGGRQRRKSGGQRP